MSDSTLRERILTLLTSVAPDVEAEAVIPGVDFREQFDFDSMDIFNFALAMNREFGVEVPETDYPQLTSLERCEAWLRPRLSQQSQ